MAILAVAACINVAFHLGVAGQVAVTPAVSARAALALVVAILAIMAGRVIPAFTRNAVSATRIRTVRGLDVCAIVSLVASLFGLAGGLHDLVLVLLAVLACVLNAARLWCWDPLSTRGHPILWILHVSYAWIPIGMLLLALARAGIAGSEALALHAIAIGAIGGMVVGMMTRTARGHTGRPLKASRAEIAAYALVHLAAAARVFVPLVSPSLYAPALVVSGGLWATAFLIYFVVYWPVLTRAYRWQAGLAGDASQPAPHARKPCQRDYAREHQRYRDVVEGCPARASHQCAGGKRCHRGGAKDHQIV